MNRFSQLRLANGGVQLIYSFPGTTDDEINLHERFSGCALGNEWFVLLDEDVSWIIQAYKHKNYNPERFLGDRLPAPNIQLLEHLLLVGETRQELVYRLKKHAEVSARQASESLAAYKKRFTKQSLLGSGFPLRARALAERETIDYHTARIAEQYGNDFLTFKK